MQDSEKLHQHDSIFSRGNPYESAKKTPFLVTGASWTENIPVPWSIFKKESMVVFYPPEGSRTFLVVYKWHFSCQLGDKKCHRFNFCHLLWEAQNNHWTKNPVFFFSKNPQIAIPFPASWGGVHDWAILTVLKARLKSDVPIIKGAGFWWIGRKKIEKRKAHFFLFGGGGA